MPGRTQPPSEFGKAGAIDRGAGRRLRLLPGFAQPAGHPFHDGPADRRIARKEPVEAGRGDLERGHLRLCGHGGGPEPAVQQGHLAEVRVRLEGGRLGSRHAHDGPSPPDQEEALPRIALGHDLGPRRELDRLRGPQHRSQLSGGEAGEQWDRSHARHLLRAHPADPHEAHGQDQDEEDDRRPPAVEETGHWLMNENRHRSTPCPARGTPAATLQEQDRSVGFRGPARNGPLQAGPAFARPPAGQAVDGHHHRPERPQPGHGVVDPPELRRADRRQEQTDHRHHEEEDRPSADPHENAFTNCSHSHEMTNAPGMVRIHAHTTRPATPHLTAEMRWVVPTPTMAPVIVCVVDTGMPAWAVKNRVAAAAASALMPPTGWSFVIRAPMVWTIRHPPNAVPRAMATSAEILTHHGTPAVAGRWCSAMSRARTTPMVFCASLVPWPRLNAADDSSCIRRKPRFNRSTFLYLRNSQYTPTMIVNASSRPTMGDSTM